MPKTQGWFERFVEQAFRFLGCPKRKPKSIRNKDYVAALNFIKKKGGCRYKLLKYDSRTVKGDTFDRNKKKLEKIRTSTDLEPAKEFLEDWKLSELFDPMKSKHKELSFDNDLIKWLGAICDTKGGIDIFRYCVIGRERGKDFRDSNAATIHGVIGQVRYFFEQILEIYERNQNTPDSNEFKKCEEIRNFLKYPIKTALVDGWDGVFGVNHVETENFREMLEEARELEKNKARVPVKAIQRVLRVFFLWCKHEMDTNQATGTSSPNSDLQNQQQGNTQNNLHVTNQDVVAESSWYQNETNQDQATEASSHCFGLQNQQGNTQSNLQGTDQNSDGPIFMDDSQTLGRYTSDNSMSSSAPTMIPNAPSNQHYNDHRHGDGQSKVRRISQASDGISPKKRTSPNQNHRNGKKRRLKREVSEEDIIERIMRNTLKRENQH